MEILSEPDVMEVESGMHLVHPSQVRARDSGDVLNVNVMFQNIGV